MSYNIDRWETKELKDFEIPIEIFHRNDECKVNLSPEGAAEVYGLAEVFVVEGPLDNDIVKVEKIEYAGVGSGSRWDYFKSILERSTGKLVAIQMWEGGDEITKLIVVEGDVTTEDVWL